MSIKEVRDRMLADIERTGRSVIGVFPDKDSADPINNAFQYTVGNGLRNLPELLIVGLCNDDYILNRLSEIMLERAKPFEDGELVEIGGKFPAYVCDAADTVKERYTNIATHFHGNASSYRIMQVVICDRDGLFPWQRGCAEPYSKVVVHRARPMN